MIAHCQRRVPGSDVKIVLSSSRQSCHCSRERSPRATRLCSVGWKAFNIHAYIVLSPAAVDRGCS